MWTVTFGEGKEGGHVGEVGFRDADHGLGAVLDGVTEVGCGEWRYLVNVAEDDLSNGIVLPIFLVEYHT
jgi:hypothetical protein